MESPYLDRDRNAARNLNPVRTTGVFLGGAKPKSIVVPVDDDGNKSKVCAQTTAAWVQESHDFSRGSSQKKFLLDKFLFIFNDQVFD